MRGRGDLVSGRLISTQFRSELWRAFAGRLGESTREAACRQLARWQRSVTMALGPASGVTAIHDVSVGELFRILGFTCVRAPSHDDIAVTVASARRAGPIPILIGLWCDRLDRLIRCIAHCAERTHTP